jgi:hypothetical protein
MIISLSDLIGTSHLMKPDRRHFTDGSDAPIMMSADESALIRVWREKVSSTSYSRLTPAAEPRTQRRRRRAAPSGGRG